MKRMFHYAPVSKALSELADKGYSVDFNLQEERIKHSPEEFTIDEVYRYEGESDPGDEATVYGITSSNGEKGVFVAGFGAFTEKSAAKVLHTLSIGDRENE
ncbi:hypothetical protein [Flavobacterium kingsejongi]|jgi:hypothetical protein|uniref:Phosphoribosylpyrophosphate synthetase n=1 Tax=Flavobacterium kingsejongi TaxID=1678728 RepID=A0A2S1LKD1_9FLAO|nr:hypothetical protein [Flavobacterium kingsejongi]AWG24224.1 hypothetical protein FK004_02800 [Flavobacterium kingsejongi]